MGLIEVVVDLFRGITVRKFLGLLFVLALLVMGYLIYEYQISANYLNKFDKAVDILQKLDRFEADTLQEQKIVKNIYSGLYQATKMNKKVIDFIIPDKYLQAIFGGIPYLILFLSYALSSRQPVEDKAHILGGSVLTSIIVAAICYFIPITWGGRWIRFLVIPLVVNLFSSLILVFLSNFFAGIAKQREESR